MLLNTLMKELLLKAPSFQQACFWFNAKNGRLGPFSYIEDSLLPSSTHSEEDDGVRGSWLLESQADRFVYFLDELGLFPERTTQCSCSLVGSALEKIVNQNTELIAEEFFPDEQEVYFGRFSILSGVLYIRTVPAPTRMGDPFEVEIRDIWFTCEEGWTGMKLRYYWNENVHNAVEVP